MYHNAGKNKLLLVDDIPENLEIIGSCLKPEYRILAARNGEKAIALAKTRKPDLILLDILMPGMDGFDVLKTLKSDKETEKIPVIFISSIDQRDIIIRGFQAGAQDYISKPYEAEELKARVATHIQLKQQADILNSINQRLENQVCERTEALQISNENLKTANERLNASSRVKSRFLNMISHELRIPLAVMSQYIELLDSELNSEKYGRYLTDLNNAWERLHLFSEKALLVTQLDSDAYAVRKETIQVLPLINQQIENLSSKWKKKSIRFSGLRNLNIQLTGDLKLFGILFLSLIDNATRYSPDGGLIRFQTGKKGKFSLMEISDEGPGFPPEVLHSAFEPFILGEDPVALKWGLSLSICHLIMRIHGGNIGLNNRNPGGAVVQLLFI